MFKYVNARPSTGFLYILLKQCKHFEPVTDSIIVSKFASTKLTEWFLLLQRDKFILPIVLLFQARLVWWNFNVDIQNNLLEQFVWNFADSKAEKTIFLGEVWKALSDFRNWLLERKLSLLYGWFPDSFHYSDKLKSMFAAEIANDINWAGHQRMVSVFLIDV